MFYASPEVKVMISNERAFINNALCKHIGSANLDFQSFGTAISNSTINIYYYYYFYYPELPCR